MVREPRSGETAVGPRDTFLEVACGDEDSVSYLSADRSDFSAGRASCSAHS